MRHERGPDPVKGGFCNNPDYSGEDTWRWTFVLEGKEHIIMLNHYQQKAGRSANSISAITVLTEDVTGQLSVQYPDVKVFTLQAVYHKN